MELVSIIIPVYEVEDYVVESVSSCISQTYKNLEIILVNDGSKDNSRNLCIEMTKTDDRIKLYDKKNGGLSDARNFGIEKASGKYLFFLDSDDLLHPECISTLVKIQRKYSAEIVSLKITRDKNFLLTDYKDNLDLNQLNRTESMKVILGDNQFGTSACSKLFLSELFESVEFPKGKLYEDLATTYKLIDKSTVCVFIEEYGYYYRVSEDSITTSTFNKQQFDLLIYSDIVENFIKCNSEYVGVEKIVISRKIRCILKILTKMTSIEYKENELFLKDYLKYLRKNYYTFLKSEYSLKHKIFGFMSAISPRLSIKILNIKKG